jgi:hypothetical protein
MSTMSNDYLTLSNCIELMVIKKNKNFLNGTRFRNWSFAVWAPYKMRNYIRKKFVSLLKNYFFSIY